jgi:hypothetical protein
MKPRRPRLAIASLLCSTPAVLLALWAFGRYWFSDQSRRAGEDLLGLGIISLWLLPLLVAGLALGLFARGFRLPCTGVGVIPFLCWGSIVITEGGL